MSDRNEMTVGKGGLKGFFSKGIFKNFHLSREMGALIALILISLVLSLLTPNFLKLTNILNILRQISVTGIIAVGMTFAIILSGIDLSVGSVFAFSGCAMALLMQRGLNPLLAVLVGLLVGSIAGCVSGTLIVKFDLPPFVATLGMMSLLRGLTLTMTNGWPISLYDIAQEYPLLFQLGQGKIGIIPIQAICMLAIIIIFSFVLSSTPFGYQVYAVGGNERAARLSGINVKRVKILVFTLSGFLTALASVLGTTYISAIEPMIGVGYELDAVAAAAIGGANLAGGSGTIVGTFLGACIMGVLYNGLVLLGVSPFMQQTFIGLIVIVAVALGGGLTNRDK